MPKLTRAEVMAEAKKSKGKNVELTSKTVHPEGLKFNEMMDDVKENKKANQPILSIEGPEGSSRASGQTVPSIDPTPLILVSPLDLHHLKVKYSEDELRNLNL